MFLHRPYSCLKKISSVLLQVHVQADHVYLVVSIPPKVSVSELVGTLKGKLAIKLFKNYPQLTQKPYWGNHFWARGYFVNTVGINEDHTHGYVTYQEGEDRKEEKQYGSLVTRHQASFIFAACTQTTAPIGRDLRMRSDFLPCPGSFIKSVLGNYNSLKINNLIFS